MKHRKILTVVAVVLLLCIIPLTLSSCMDEKDYYTKDDISSLTLELESKIIKSELESNTKIEALKTEHKQKIAELKAENEKSEGAILALTESYNEKVAELSAADKANSDAWAALEAKYDAELAKLTTADEANEKSIADLTAAYNEDKAALIEEAEENAEAIAKVEADYKAAVAALSEEADKNAEAIAKVEADYKTAVGELEAEDKKNAEAIAKVEADYKAAVAALNSSISANNTKIASLEESLADEIATVKEETNEKIAEIQGYIDELESTDEENTKKIAQLEAKIEELLSRHEHKFGDWIVWDESATSCTKTFFYRICGECGILECKKPYQEHNLVHHEAKAPTCTEIGWDAYDTCERSGCEYTTYEEKLAGHTDDDENGECDFCSKKMSSGGSSNTGYPEVPWEVGDITLKFMMSENTNGKQTPSGCHRYLAGDSGDRSDLDTLVLNRNSDAAYYTKVEVTYDYYPDTNEYGWGQANDVIYKNCSSMMAGKPDIYCNFLYDLSAASLNGAFNNLMNQDLDKGNYFQFLDEGYNEAVDNKGYMYEFMTSTTLSQHKMYILASDYFIDLIRSFFVVPVNIALLEAVGMNITGDLNHNGKFTIEDFYEEVRNKDWDYQMVMDYSDAIYSNKGHSNSGEDIEDIIGFAISAGGVSKSGLLYSTNVKVIDKIYNPNKEVAGMPGVYGDYEYTYPTNAEPLVELAVALKKLVEALGVYYLTGVDEDPNMTNYGSTAPLAIRSRFCDNKILFGDVILLGALEYTEYQELKDSSGFGVVPVPFHHAVEKDSNENYLTSIHNNSRPGAIAKNTKNFTACTAFLDYQSTHSTQILNDYYNVNLQANVVDDSEEGGTVRMLQYIRSNVRSVFEKTFEDAIGFYEKSLDGSKWHGLIGNFTLGEGLRDQYDALREDKQKVLDTLYQKYPNLP